MKFTQRFATIVTVILACVMGGGLWLLPAENTHALVNSSSLSEQELYEIPKNPSLKGGNAEAFGDFAWKTFVALNWPAHCQGFPLNPLTEKEILQDSKAPRVWEFYSSPEDIFMPNRAKPDPKPVVIPPQCQDPSSSTTGQNLRLMESASEPIQLELALPEQLIKNNMNIGDYLPSRDLPSEPEQLEKLASNLKQYLTKNKQRYYFIDDQKIKTLLPDDKPLVDRAGNYVLNEVRMNDVEVDQILNNGWYSAANLAKFDNDGNPFQLMCSSNAKEQGGVYPSKDNRKVPCTENTSMGTIEIKAAWMILPQKNNAPSLPSPDPAKYYTTQRTLIMKTVEPSGDEKTVKIVTKKVTVPVALVGFHIIQKTSRTGWIWATFEQIDNVPEEGVGSVAPESRYYNLYDPNCYESKPESYEAESKSKCQENKPLATQPYLWRDTFPHAVTIKDGKIQQQTPSQITRQVPIPSFAKSLNDKWKEKLKDSVWQNYQLIGVQWLEAPYLPYGNERTVTPNQLANVTLEPYPQQHNQGFSCIGCHTRAKLPNPQVYSDFSFLMRSAK